MQLWLSSSFFISPTRLTVFEFLLKKTETGIKFICISLINQPDRYSLLVGFAGVLSEPNRYGAEFIVVVGQ